MEGPLARELVVELEDLTRAVRGSAGLVANALEVEVPPGEAPEAQPEIRGRLHTHRPRVNQ
jgi:hypothetical protein